MDLSKTWTLRNMIANQTWFETEHWGNKCMMIVFRCCVTGKVDLQVLVMPNFLIISLAHIDRPSYCESSCEGRRDNYF